MKSFGDNNSSTWKLFSYRFSTNFLRRKKKEHLPQKKNYYSSCSVLNSSHYIEQLRWWKYYWDSSSTNSNLFSDKSLQYSLKPRIKNKQYSRTIAVIEMFREKKIPDFWTFINKDTIHFFMWSKNKQQLLLQSHCCGFNVIDKSIFQLGIFLKMFLPLKMIDKRTNKSHWNIGTAEAECYGESDCKTRNFLSHFFCQIFFEVIINKNQSLRRKCPYSELLWSVFSRIRTEYGPE